MTNLTQSASVPVEIMHKTHIEYVTKLYNLTIE
jgi:hypothetical protein